jgi:hypothetical protein
MKNILLLLLLYNISAFPSFSQNKFEQDITNYKRNIKTKYNVQIKSILGKDYDDENLNYKIFPFVHYVTTSKKDSTFMIENLKIDSFNCIIIIHISNNKKAYVFQLQEGSLSKRDGSLFNELTMIEFAEKYSQQPFFTNFFDDNYNTLAFFNKGNLCVIDDNLNLYNSFEDYLSNKYGCPEKYWEMRQKEIVKCEKLQEMNLSLAKKEARNDYGNWQIYFPEDTTKIVELFLNEVESIITLKKNQRSLLKKEIYVWLKQKFSLQYHSLFILGKDVSSALMFILTEDQYFTYLKQYSQRDYSAANDYLYKYYTTEKNLTPQEYEVFFKNEILLSQ